MIIAKKKGVSLLTVAVVAALCSWAADAFSQRSFRSRLRGGADVCIVSKYVWRGYVHNDDFALQPDFYLGYGNFIASVWGSMNLTGRGDIGIDSKWKFSELDYILQCGIPTRAADLSFGYSLYAYPNTPNELRESTQELCAKGAFKVFLDPTVELFYDVHEVEGWYGRALATYSHVQGV